LPLFESDP